MRDKYTTAGRPANDSVLVPAYLDPSYSVQSLQYAGHAGDMEFYYVSCTERGQSGEIALILFVTKDGRVDNYAFDSAHIA